MLAGVPPFRAKSRQALQQQITSGKIKWPKFLSPNALSLLKGLLTRDPEKRLGAGPNGSAAIRAHPFFKVQGGLKGACRLASSEGCGARRLQPRCAASCDPDPADRKSRMPWASHTAANSLTTHHPHATHSLLRA